MFPELKGRFPLLEDRGRGGVKVDSKGKGSFLERERSSFIWLLRGRRGGNDYDSKTGRGGEKPFSRREERKRGDYYVLGGGDKPISSTGRR